MTTIVAAAGGGNWNTGATWVGGVAPTAADDVQIASSSGAITINGASVCRSLDCTGYTGTLTHNSASALSIGDATAGLSSIALKLVAGMTYTKLAGGSSSLSFISTNATVQTITMAGKTTGNVTFNGAGGSWKLQDALGQWAGGDSLTLTAGTLDTNGQAVTYGFFASSNANTRVLTLGASTLTFLDGGFQIWNIATSTGLTLNAGTSTIILSGAAAIFTGGGKTYATLRLTGTGIDEIRGANTFANLERSNAVAVTLTLPIATTTLTGTLTTSGSSGNLVTFNSITPGTPATISKASGTVSENWMSVKDSTATGGAAFYAGANSTNVSGNTGWIFTAAPSGPPLGSMLLVGVGG